MESGEGKAGVSQLLAAGSGNVLVTAGAGKTLKAAVRGASSGFGFIQ